MAADNFAYNEQICSNAKEEANHEICTNFRGVNKTSNVSVGAVIDGSHFEYEVISAHFVENNFFAKLLH